jgi:hypothetical protein
LRPAVEGVGALACLYLDELGCNLETLVLFLRKLFLCGGSELFFVIRKPGKASPERSGEIRGSRLRPSPEAGSGDRAIPGCHSPAAADRCIPLR